MSGLRARAGVLAGMISKKGEGGYARERCRQVYNDLFFSVPVSLFCFALACWQCYQDGVARPVFPCTATVALFVVMAVWAGLTAGVSLWMTDLASGSREDAWRDAYEAADEDQAELLISMFGFRERSLLLGAHACFAGLIILAQVGGLTAVVACGNSIPELWSMEMTRFLAATTAASAIVAAIAARRSRRKLMAAMPQAAELPSPRFFR